MMSASTWDGEKGRKVMNYNLELSEVPFTTRQIPGRFPRLTRNELDRESNLRLEERRKERARIARELHDTLLQGFLSASMQLCMADEWLPADSPAKPVLRRGLDLMRRCIDEGRAALQGLRSPALPDGSLERALCDLRDDFASSEGGRLRIVILGQTKSLDPAIQEQVYLIAREALRNALRHSEASTVEAEIEYLPRKLRVVVRDNGTGIDPQALRSSQNCHWGLTGMRERAANVGAQLRLWSKRGEGTEVEITVPVNLAASP